MKSPTSRFGARLLSPARLPRQLQRVVPIYLALVFVFVFFWKAEYFAPRFNPADLIQRVLTYQYPLQSTPTKTTFPKKIWQTWKIDPLEFAERDAGRARSWTSLNPSYRYESRTGYHILY
jgi:mannosyltransferase OCH1-like enzyme